MDPNLKNSIDKINKHFKEVCDNAHFKKRMGVIKAGKKQIIPKF